MVMKGYRKYEVFTGEQSEKNTGFDTYLSTCLLITNHLTSYCLQIRMILMDKLLQYHNISTTFRKRRFLLVALSLAE